MHDLERLPSLPKRSVLIFSSLGERPKCLEKAHVLKANLLMPGAFTERVSSETLDVHRLHVTEPTQNEPPSKSHPETRQNTRDKAGSGSGFVDDPSLGNRERLFRDCHDISLLELSGDRI
jgi:hypothetical protein